jgi:hypothetical protein
LGTRFNGNDKKIGTVDDIVVSPTEWVSYAIVGVGGFLVVARHDVAVSVDQSSDRGGKLILAGASKQALKSMPPHEYANQLRALGLERRSASNFIGG